MWLRSLVPFEPPRPVVRLLQACVVTALVAGTTAFVTLDKTVTVSVDGHAREVRTFARSVGEVLDSQGIQFGRNDLVVPSPDRALQRGEHITVRFGRPVSLTVDGRHETVWTTARSVDEALMMLGIRSQGAVVSASRSARIARAGIALVVRLPHDLTFLADGKRSQLTTAAPTVAAALSEANIALRPADRLNVDAASVPTDEQVIAVTRVDGKRVVEEKAVPYRTVRAKTAALFKGETRVRTKGKVGARVLTWSLTYVDRKLASRKLVSNRIAVQPVTQVLLVGTKPRPAHSAAADGLNWAALARCESGGNPNAYNPAGPYYGLYQFSSSTWHSVGGSGLPTDFGASEQTYRAQLLYRRSGAGQWPVCGRYL
ncbi:MAG: resuscitation-promoting factor RpfB [Actinomycetota bacterium]|nr:resuscitation-promoting factor RpfB [Actinomycetota bacterium]